MQVLSGKALFVTTLAALLPVIVAAQTAPATVATTVAPSVPVSVVSSAASPFAAPVVLRGKLGDDAVQMRLQPKVEDADSVEGEYFIFGKGSKILLAGEVSGTALSMEESEDGIDVSGQWDGKLDGKTLRGTWVSDDGSVSKPFVLEIQPAGLKVPKPSGKPVKKSAP
ncbi:hypothetical protein [Undibacterium sp.]|uniref:hypothetical protein n=1 Tax=Undibacterium sp. TaxID=1914977 RepID=UPI00374CD6C5